MKKIVLILAGLLIVFALSACSSKDDSTVLVKTDTGNITKADLYKDMKKNYGQSAMYKIVFTKLLSEKYKDSEESIKKKVDEQIKEAKSQFQSDDQFKNALQQQGFPDEEAYRQSLKINLLVEKATTDGVKVSDKEIQDYYDKNKDQFTEKRASHIVVKTKDQADTIEKELKNGSDFATLAKQHSTDGDTSKNGGDLGWINSETSNDMSPTVLQTVSSLKKGKVSDPIQPNSGGYEIIKVTDTKIQPLKDIKSQIKDTLTGQKAKPISEVLKKLTEEYHVKIEDDDFKDVFTFKDTDTGK